jgi:hypothetical protein
MRKDGAETALLEIEERWSTTETIVERSEQTLHNRTR